jgi:hypothetical protein
MYINEERDEKCIPNFSREFLIGRSARHKRRWEDNIEIDLREIGYGAWVE